MFVGISKRTNEAGAASLAKAFGSSLPVIPIPVVRERSKTYYGSTALVYHQSIANSNATASQGRALVR